MKNLEPNANPIMTEETYNNLRQKYYDREWEMFCETAQRFQDQIDRLTGRAPKGESNLRQL